MRVIEQSSEGVVLRQGDRTLTLPADITPEALTLAAQAFFMDEVPELPPEVPMYKVRKLLIKLGMKAQIEAVIHSMQASDDPEVRMAGDLANEDWEYAPNFVRLSPLVQSLGQAIGLTPEQIDDLVLQANAIP